MTNSGHTILEVRNLRAGYGSKTVIHDVSLSVKQSEIVALVGPNGAGKSTLLRAAFGIIPASSGSIIFKGNDVTEWPSTRRLDLGCGFLPQGSPVFDELSVLDNLMIGGYHLRASESRRRIREVIEIFPLLDEKLSLRANKLSGGEKQILGLARVLVRRPDTILLDEPSAGLSPFLSKSTFDHIKHLNKTYKMSILVVEQKVHRVLGISHRAYVLRMGKVVLEGAASSVLSDREVIREAFL